VCLPDKSRTRATLWNQIKAEFHTQELRANNRLVNWDRSDSSGGLY